MVEGKRDRDLEKEEGGVKQRMRIRETGREKK